MQIAVGLTLAPSPPSPSVLQYCSNANKHCHILLLNQKRNRRHFHPSVTSCWNFSHNIRKFTEWKFLHVSGYPVCWHVNTNHLGTEIWFILLSLHIFSDHKTAYLSHKKWLYVCVCLIVCLSFCVYVCLWLSVILYTIKVSTPNCWSCLRPLNMEKLSPMCTGKGQENGGAATNVCLSFGFPFHPCATENSLCV